jgi:enamine deaminase RidA (YjgF/YER057c/UK114 family)
MATVKKEFLNPAGLPDWSDIFSQVVKVQAGSTTTIYISGQVAVDREHNIRGDTLETQMAHALENLDTALAAAGATRADVVKVTLFIKEYRPEYSPLIRQAYNRFFGRNNLPACNWIGVQALANQDFLIEIDAIAVIPTALQEEDDE